MKQLKLGVFMEVQIVIVCWEFLLGLEYFYMEGKIYRDIKVVNVLFFVFGDVKLGMFMIFFFIIW